MESLINEHTQLIQEDIPTVLAYLFETYGKIPSEEVKQKDSQIRTMTFHPADPMIMLYNPVEQLCKMAKSAGIDYSEQQILDLALTVIQNTRDFERALGEWAAKPAEDKTWDNFKHHFILAQKQLKEIRGPTMQQAGYHQVNLLASKLREDLANQNNKPMTLLHTAIDTESQTAPTVASTQVSAFTPATQQVNAATTNMVQLEILKLLKYLQAKLPSTMTAPTPAPAPAPRQRCQGKKTPDDSTYPRRDTSKYCWTHGACGHDSPNCNRQAIGHQTNATFENKLGGSKAHCA